MVDDVDHNYTVTGKSSLGLGQVGDLQESRVQPHDCPVDQEQHSLLLRLSGQDNSADGD